MALVTGALRGIGLAAARRMAAAGARVVFTDLVDGADALATAGLDGLNGCAYVRANVAEEADWQAVRDLVRRDFGRLDILVNNAGIDCTGPVHELSLEQWHRLMRVNLDGVFLGVKTFAEMLRDTGGNRVGGSSIVNVSSIMGLVGYADTSAYNSSKGAVRLFTKATA
ncbi:MAG: SDR family NAD(P)-dependent oxidoreductase, partial [Alphaproteobacteria bacterium]